MVTSSLRLANYLNRKLKWDLQYVSNTSRNRGTRSHDYDYGIMLSPQLRKYDEKHDEIPTERSSARWLSYWRHNDRDFFVIFFRAPRRNLSVWLYRNTVLCTKNYVRCLLWWLGLVVLYCTVCAVLYCSRVCCSTAVQHAVLLFSVHIIFTFPLPVPLKQMSLKSDFFINSTIQFNLIWHLIVLRKAMLGISKSFYVVMW